MSRGVHRQVGLAHGMGMRQVETELARQQYRRELVVRGI